MMGKQEEGQEGIIPQVCQDLFRHIKEDSDEDMMYSVEVIIVEFIFIPLLFNRKHV